MTPDDANACEVTACIFIAQSLERCEAQRCPFAWQRRGREDRERRKEKDRRATEGAA